MEAILEYWNPRNETVVTETGFRYLDTKSIITKEVTIKGSKEEIFKEFDKRNNSLRYCNGSHYTFKDKTLQEEYIVWYKSLSESTRFDMFYGNGVVD